MPLRRRRKTTMMSALSLRHNLRQHRLQKSAEQKQLWTIEPANMCGKTASFGIESEKFSARCAANCAGADRAYGGARAAVATFVAPVMTE